MFIMPFYSQYNIRRLNFVLPVSPVLLHFGVVTKNSMATKLLAIQEGHRRTVSRLWQKFNYIKDMKSNMNIEDIVAILKILQ